MKHQIWLWLLMTAVLCYLAAVAFMYSSQDQMLYPATRMSPESATQRSRELGLVPWPETTPETKGFLSARSNAPVGTVLVFHGNAGSALDRSYYVEAFERLGLRVLLMEYPGYGHRPGSIGERYFAPDALDSFDRARQEFDGPIYVVGESLGAGVASIVASQRAQEVAGVCLITPWNSLPHLAQTKYPWLPAKWLMKSSFDNKTSLASYSGPTAIAIALEDEIIPNSHSRRLYDSLSGHKRLWEFSGAGHNSWPTSADSQWWGEVVEFWRSSPSPSARNCYGVGLTSVSTVTTSAP